jgi:hypothetical protein
MQTQKKHGKADMRICMTFVANTPKIIIIAAPFVANTPKRINIATPALCFKAHCCVVM